MKHGFKLISRNYNKKWGEIDIIAKKAQKLHFIEVKSVSCQNVSHETLDMNPAENIHAHKIKRLERVIQSYLLEYKITCEWELSALLVFIDLGRKQAKIEHIRDIFL